MRGAKTGGRLAGTPNKLTIDLKEALRPHIQDTIKELIRLSKSAENETVRLKAGEIVMDRYFGKASQTLEHTGTISLGSLIEQIWNLQGQKPSTPSPDPDKSVH